MEMHAETAVGMNAYPCRTALLGDGHRHKGRATGDRHLQQRGVRPQVARTEAAATAAAQQRLLRRARHVQAAQQFRLKSQGEPRR